MKLTMLAAATALSAAATFAGQALKPYDPGVPRKKILSVCHEFSWCSTSNILANADAYDEVGTDGCCIEITGDAIDGRAPMSYMVMRDKRKWPLDAFKNEVPRLKELRKHKAFKELFIGCFRAPAFYIPWEDDAMWEMIGTHIRAIAWAAREAGCPGLSGDQEEYFGVHQFIIKADDPRSWEELAALARRRGRQIFEQAFAEFPDMKLFFYRFMMIDPGFWNYYANASDPVAEMKGMRDLWPAFANGVLDAMPETVRLVEGDETGYRYESEFNGFYYHYNEQRAQMVKFVAPENRAKFYAVMRSAFPVYLDMYSRYKPSNANYYRGPKDGSRAAHMERNFAQAFRASDEYVWLYAERHPFIRWPGRKLRQGMDADHTWFDCFPGFKEVMEANVDPDGCGRRIANEIKSGRTYPDAIKNGDCRLEGHGDFVSDRKLWPKNFSVWSRNKGDGRIGFDMTVGHAGKGAFRGEGCTNSCVLISSSDVKCGEYYYVTASIRNPDGKFVRLQTPLKGYGHVNWTENLFRMPLSEPDADGWCHAAKFIRIPDKCEKILLTIGFKPKETTLVDDIHFYRVIDQLKDGPLYGGAAQAADELKARATRDGIGHVMAKIRAGKEVGVAYLGGSITQMNGWRRLTQEWLAKRYPQAKFREINAAIGGTGSDLGVYRVGKDVIARRPDLVFVEFATNDSPKDPEGTLRNFDGIVRQIWANDPETDIVFVYTVTATSVKHYLDGRRQPTAEAMERLAQHYGIPSVDWGVEVARQCRAGKLIMSMGEAYTAVAPDVKNRDAAATEMMKREGKTLFAKDGVHPALPGHMIYSAELSELWKAMEGVPPVDHRIKGATACFSPKMERAKIVPIDRSMLDDGWEPLEKLTLGNWDESLDGKQDQVPIFSSRAGKLWKAARAGAELKFRFHGSSCAIYDLLGPGCGIAEVTVDGKRLRDVSRFDGYSSYYRLGSFKVFDGEEGLHEVKIVRAAKSPAKNHVKNRLPGTSREKYKTDDLLFGSILLVGDMK